MPVDVEVGDVPVHPLANLVGQPSDREHVRRAIERQGIFRREPFAGQDLRGDGLQPRVVGLECVLGCGRHLPLNHNLRD